MTPNHSFKFFDVCISYAHHSQCNYNKFIKVFYLHRWLCAFVCQYITEIGFWQILHDIILCMSYHLCSAILSNLSMFPNCFSCHSLTFSDLCHGITLDGLVALLVKCQNSNYKLYTFVCILFFKDVTDYILCFITNYS